MMTCTVATLLLLVTLLAALYAGARLNVQNLREQLEDAYDARDEAIVGRQAAEAKAEYLAAALRAAAETAELDEADAYLMSLEADLPGECHGLAELISVNDVPDIAEEA